MDLCVEISCMGFERLYKGCFCRVPCGFIPDAGFARGAAGSRWEMDRQEERKEETRKRTYMGSTCHAVYGASAGGGYTQQNQMGPDCGKK